MLNAVDWVRVMAYDGGDGEHHSSYDFTVNSATYWCDTRKMSTGKVVLGVPFCGCPDWASYGGILAADPDTGDKDHVTVSGIDVWYNDISAVEKKTAYIKNNLGGITIWGLTQDTDNSSKSLLSATGRDTQ